MIVLLKLGIDYQTIMGMSSEEVASFISAFNDLANPGKTVKKVVRKVARP